MDISNDTPTNSPVNAADTRSEGYDLRLHADVNRAVGGLINQLREISRISATICSEIQAEWMVKRVLFLSYEFESQLVARENLSERERLDALNRFFFVKKQFGCQSDPAKLAESCDAFLLGRVLVTRMASPIVLALLYAILAERVGVTLDFVDLKPACLTKYFLRWNETAESGTRARFIDLSRGGTTLTSDELIATLQSRFEIESDVSNVLEAMSFESLLSDYLQQLKTAYLPHGEIEKTLFLQNALISYQPSNLQLIGERAVLHRRLGNFRSALADLKRFFAFIERERAPNELVKLHEELTRLLERHNSLIDLVE